MVVAAAVHGAVLVAGSQAVGATPEEDSSEAIDLLRRYLAASEQPVQIRSTAVANNLRYPESRLADGSHGQGRGGDDDREAGTEAKAGTGDLASAGKGRGGEGKGKGAAPRPPTKVPVGKLPAEVIQVVVRQNTGRVRLCFEQAAYPSSLLHRRVTVRFVIGPTGAVSSSTVAQSDLFDRGVAECVARAFQSFTFPRPEGGVVVVSYPVMFPPGG